MTDRIDAPSPLDDHGRIYAVDSGTQRLNWFCATVFVAFAMGCVYFGFLWPSATSYGPPSTFYKMLLGAVAAASLCAALYGVRFNQLATFLYPDRIVSRGLFTQGCLHREDIAGYKIIPGRGPQRLKLIARNSKHKNLYVNKISADAAFEKWFSDLPELG